MVQDREPLFKGGHYRVHSQTSMAHGLYDDSLFRTDTDLTEDSDTEEFEDENIGSKRKVSLKF